MKKTIVALAICVVTTSAFAQYDYRRSTVVDSRQTQAVVVQVTPTYESIVVGNHCQPVQEQPQSQNSNVIATVAGGVIGAVVGSRFGGGSGRYVATGAGAIGGSMLGNHLANSNQPSQRMHCVPITQPQVTGNAYVAEINGVRFSGHTFRPLRVGDLVYVNTTTMINRGE